ncbi:MULTISPECIES: A/G-specific adenine glycosylase [unclassified Polynucleobacter]|uniref:A/G-specific adenine glycosylase n=1 Tax=unclassified Polynucleobacter TaxID=2640945 RepID=UPI002573D31D|nr:MULTISPECIES: A/G-specific adenine glycosylase [unclassified Polynucleobacter]BEI43473.1 A/G-specific adenine glycosylase [Polynucleobacter sp. HIN10]BEI45251.1 A/G-specific adenine glycosylase [Polynucleobacter sp. HIN11]
MGFHFSQALIRWSKHYGRQGLPWQGHQDPYAVWVSEIMLQQTQVSTVMQRYPQFMRQFPTVKALASADLDAVMALWSGLGYYSRARNLHRCSQEIMAKYAGQFPRTAKELEQLPGIGRSTAGAIAAFAFEERAPILDANVKRVISRFFGVTGDQQSHETVQLLWEHATALLPKSKSQMPIYTQALMDFGATWCTPKAAKCQSQDQMCPMKSECKAYELGQVDLIPAKKKKKESPTFTTNIFLIRYQDEILLERRAPKAIWGGLYSLIETPWEPIEPKINRSKPSDVTSLLNQTVLSKLLSKSDLGSIASVEKGHVIEHVFSHRRLRMQPWIIHLKRKWSHLSATLDWICTRRLKEYGLPQPIRVFLESSSR